MGIIKLVSHLLIPSAEISDCCVELGNIMSLLSTSLLRFLEFYSHFIEWIGELRDLKRQKVIVGVQLFDLRLLVFLSFLQIRLSLQELPAFLCRGLIALCDVLIQLCNLSGFRIPLPLNRVMHFSLFLQIFDKSMAVLIHFLNLLLNKCSLLVQCFVLTFH